MQRQLRSFGAALVVLATVNGAAPARGAGPVDFTERFNLYSGFPEDVQLRVWAPEEVSRIRGVVFSIPGSGGDTRGTTANSAWQQRLRQIGFAFIGVRDLPGNYWGNVAEEGQENMQAMLDGAAEALGRPEISNAPMFVYGISHGGWGASLVAQYFAPRVLGFYADKGAADPIFGFGDAQRNVPGMMVAGSQDNLVPPGYVEDVFSSWNPNSRVALGIEWGVGHINSPDNLRLAFMQEVIARRYPAGQTPSLTPDTPLQLVDLPYDSGWLGQANSVQNVGGVDQVTSIEWPTIAPAAQYAGSQPTSWMPSEAMAMIYRAVNNRPAGIASNAFTFTAGVSTTESAAIALNVRLTGITYSSIDLYLKGERIAQFGYAPGTQQFVYPTVDAGHHTFVAVATYAYNGQTHYTSKYVTFDTFGPSTSDYSGDFDHDRMTTSADLSRWSENLGRYDYGLRGDSDGDADVDGDDFLAWQRGFGKSWSLAHSVPEPGGGEWPLVIFVVTQVLQRGRQARTKLAPGQ